MKKTKYKQMSLMQNLSFPDYQRAKDFSLRQCELIAKLAEIEISVRNSEKPGELLINELDKRGFSVEQYKNLVEKAKSYYYYKPASKVAILIANSNYKNLSKLVTPVVDCNSLACHLTKMDFIVCTVKNTEIRNLKDILIKIFAVVPEDSYCFIFYAGHGCEVSNMRCILGIECPEEDIQMEHSVTENFLLREVAKSKPDLCFLIMDMCRMILDFENHPKIYASIAQAESYSIHKNLLIGYTTVASGSAYECIQVVCSASVNSNETYEIKDGDTNEIVPIHSQYVDVLCKMMNQKLNVSSLLDKVHADVENNCRKQRPIKVQCGTAKRSLHDPVTGDIKSILNKLKETLNEYTDTCTVEI